MSQERSTSQEGQALPDIPSPCQNICVLDPSMVCIGCGRTASEVASWSIMPREEKAAVIARLEREGLL
ncbi:MAG TPA: DUF1289 domain-containing protein [Bacteroidales bacterium]|nr:DUF1289 domain-containing protein [Bacteroidales bacterium]HRZ77050.1 DUF1289 domain-containing protein [Bacteroidales bacterium]